MRCLKLKHLCLFSQVEELSSEMTTRAKVIFRNEATVNQFYIDTHAEEKIPKLRVENALVLLT